jgi:hypothetical protein
MPVRITLRSRRDFSPFREMLKRLIESPEGDSLVLCSGYIWEPATGYKVSDDELLDTLQRGCSQGEITTIAGKLDEQWIEYYRNFVRRLKNANLNVTPYFAPKRNWHAKIAIRLKEYKPIAAIIGSSNLTGPAYGENKRTWNFEGDVLIWSNSRTMNSYFKKPLHVDMPFGDLQLVLDPRTRQPNELQQLESIYKDTLSDTNSFEKLKVE